MTKPIKLLFGMVSGVGPVNGVLDGLTRWLHLTNTFERLCAAAISKSVITCGYAVCYQITLSKLVVVVVVVVDCNSCRRRLPVHYES